MATGNWLDLGLMPYTPAFAIQEQILQARLSGLLGTTVILQENLPVFTIGRSGSRDNILAAPDDLQQRGIEVLEVNRGGDVTYHGPGQLIVSPLLYLGDVGLNANQYLHRLEDVLIELLAGYDIRSGKKEGYPGVWLKDAKIAAVGIAVKHGFTFHGFSLNVNPDLECFNLINPCGVSRMPVTSIRQVLGTSPPVAQVMIRLRQILEEYFGFDTRSTSWAELLKSIEPEAL
jgi:lipoyl(octanoyl) transferase